MSSGPKCLILGLGNDLVSDDAIGLRVAAAVRDQLTDVPEVTVRETEEAGLGLLDLVVGYDHVLLIDAIQTGQATPGYLHEWEGEPFPASTGLSPHFLGIAEVLALGRELGLAVPGHVRIFAIEVQDPFTLGSQMTPALTAALPSIVRRVIAAARSAAKSASRLRPQTAVSHVPSRKAAQGEFNFDSGQDEQGYAQWLSGRKMAAQELARRMNLPLGH